MNTSTDKAYIIFKRESKSFFKSIPASVLINNRRHKLLPGQETVFEVDPGPVCILFSKEEILNFEMEANEQATFIAKEGIFNPKFWWNIMGAILISISIFLSLRNQNLVFYWSVLISLFIFTATFSLIVNRYFHLVEE